MLDSSKRLWLNDVERDAFIEETCGSCYQPDQALARITGAGPGCPHLMRADAGKLPRVWTRRNGAHAVIGKTYKCDDRLAQPPVNRRGKAPADTPPMIDVAEADRNLVPVENWPDYRAEQRKLTEGDHQ